MKAEDCGVFMIFMEQKKLNKIMAMMSGLLLFGCAPAKEEKPFDWIKEAESIQIISSRDVSITYENNDFFEELANALNNDARLDNEEAIGGSGFILRAGDQSLVCLAGGGKIMMDDNIYVTYWSDAYEYLYKLSLALVFEDDDPFTYYHRHEAEDLDEFFEQAQVFNEKGVLSLNASVTSDYSDPIDPVQVYDLPRNKYTMYYVDKTDFSYKEAVYDWKERIAVNESCEYHRNTEQYSEECDDYDKRVIEGLLETFLATRDGRYIEEEIFLETEDDYQFEN